MVSQPSARELPGTDEGRKARATSDGDSFAKALTMIADGLDVSVTRNAEPRA